MQVPLPSDSDHERIGADLGRLVDQKNIAYGGNSMPQIADVLNLMYPWGIRDAQMLDATAMVRIFDKLFRIARGDKKAFSENPWQDIAGYALRMIQIEEDENATVGLDRSPETPSVEQDNLRDARPRVRTVPGDAPQHTAERNPPSPARTPRLHNTIWPSPLANRHSTRVGRSSSGGKNKRR